MTPYNPILDSDSYKLLSHYNMLPDDVLRTFSYAESRGGRYPANVFFGLQPWLIQLQDTPITLKMVAEAEEIALAHGGHFNSVGWRIIATELNGRLPVRIKAVPEGTVVPTGNVLVTIENTDTRFAWLPGFLETAMLRQVWYSTTVATRIWTMKNAIQKRFEQSADSLDALPFALLDFSSRGCASREANAIGATSYLLSFLGTDSVPALRFCRYYYDENMAGYSVPATEHSIMCSWGTDEEAFKAMIDRYEGGIVSIVADTWDVFRAAKVAASLADYAKGKNVTLVFRPDSGKPLDVLPLVLRRLEEGFGVTVNSKGYKVLCGAKVLWGDGIDEDTCVDPFDVAIMHGYSAESIMVGSGGGLMQADMTRDTSKFAFKASAIYRAGMGWQGIAKDPVTDPGKKSKMGRLKLIKSGGDGPYKTVQESDAGIDCLQTVFLNGDVVECTTLQEARSRLATQ